MKSVELKATAVVTSRDVRVTYTLKNLRRTPIFVFDLAFGAAYPRHDFETIEFAEPDILVLASRLFAPPPGVSWAMPPEIYATRVGPDETLRLERIQPLPLEVTASPFALRPPPVPGGSPTAQTTTPQHCNVVRISIGFALDAEELSARAEPALGEGVWVLRPTAVKHQQLSSTEIRNVSVSVSK